MADIQIKYACGCGKRSGSLEAACRHADEAGHTVPVIGEIRPSQARQRTVSPLATKPADKAPVSVSSADIQSLEALRARLTKGK